MNVCCDEILETGMNDRARVNGFERHSCNGNDTGKTTKKQRQSISWGKVTLNFISYSRHTFTPKRDTQTDVEKRIRASLEFLFLFVVDIYTISRDQEGINVEKHLTSESVESASLTLKSVDNIERSNSLSLGVLGVGDRVTDDRLEERLEDSTGLLVDQARDTLDTTTTSQSTNSGLSDSFTSLCVRVHSSNTIGNGRIPWMLSRKIFR